MGLVDAIRAAPRDIGRTVADFSAGGRVPVARKTAQTPDGRTIAYADMGGQGLDVLLIHGTLMTLEDMWLGPADVLAQSGFRVMAVDRPGHGESARARLVDASPWRQAEILHDAMMCLGKSPTIVGHSAGGAVALAYGMLFPDDVSGIVALAPICFPEPRLEQILFGARAALLSGPFLAAGSRMSTDRVLLPTLRRAMFLPQRMPERFEAMFPFALAGRPAQLIAEAEDSLALGPGLLRSVFNYSSCRVPVEILGGDADIVVANAMHGLRAAAMIPNASYRSLPEMGHMLHHFRSEEVVKAVQRINKIAG